MIIKRCNHFGMGTPIQIGMPIPKLAILLPQIFFSYLTSAIYIQSIQLILSKIILLPQSMLTGGKNGSKAAALLHKGLLAGHDFLLALRVQAQ